MQKNKEKILLVGAGPMAMEYAKVLKSLNYPFVVVGRSKKSAKEFEKIIGVKVITGGVDKLSTSKIPVNSIIAVSEEQLGKVTLKLLKFGVKNILVEKPAGLDFNEVKKVNNLALNKNAKVYVGYNRRFYQSVKTANELIKKDGGILSIFFDFTEATFKITPLKKGRGVKENWFLQNSTHVVDLAFFLAGNPKKLSSFTGKSLSWHKRGAIFTGGGITKNNVFFSYHANWISPGRWGVEIMTKNHKLFLRPLEKLQIQNLGTFEVKDVELDDKLDLDFKPGIYREVKSFLGDKKDLCTISEQEENLKYYQKILSP